MRSAHYIEALSLGYQMLECIFVFLLTKTTVGNDGVPLSNTKIRNAETLISKARLALSHGFIDQAIYHEVESFNRARRDIIHNMVAKNIDYERVEQCARMVGPLYSKVQGLFFKITTGKPEAIR